MELGKKSGKISTAGRQETLWWNQEVQEKLKDKRKAKKVYGIPSEMMQASWMQVTCMNYQVVSVKYNERNIQHSTNFETTTN